MKTKKQKRNPTQTLWAYFVERTKSNIALFVLMAAYSVLSLGSSIYFMTQGNVRDILSCFVYFLIVPLFYVIERYMRIKVPMPYALFLMAFMTLNLIGAGYNLYFIFPPLDDCLHAMWGFVFMVFGFAVMKVLLGEPKNRKQLVVYVLFSVAFCALTAVIWEIYEFTWDEVSPTVDLQEDCIITGFNSFMLHDPCDHLNTVKIDGIAYTILYDAMGNEIYRIEGGYLDVGLKDTMWYMIWCTVSSVSTSVVIALDWCFGKKWIYNALIPKLREVPQEDNSGENSDYADGGDRAEEVTATE